MTIFYYLNIIFTQDNILKTFVIQMVSHVNDNDDDNCYDDDYDYHSSSLWEFLGKNHRKGNSFFQIDYEIYQKKKKVRNYENDEEMR